MVELIQGGKSFDDRGSVSFVNEFNPMDLQIKRFYTVENYKAGFVRAWHGHQIGGKYLMVLSGAALVKCFPLEWVKDPDWTGDPGYYKDNETWENCPDLKSFTLVEHQPKILWIPPGYYNGFKTLLPGTRVMFFTNTSMEQDKEDDYRLPYDIIPSVWDDNPR